jgi:hypothetical protein
MPKKDISKEDDEANKLDVFRKLMRSAVSCIQRRKKKKRGNQLIKNTYSIAIFLMSLPKKSTNYVKKTSSK